METKLYPLFNNKEGQPFVFWDARRSRLHIRHGKRLTTVYYDDTDVFSCKDFLTIFKLAGKPEQYLYSNGRIIASYLAPHNAIVVKRDGDIFSFSFDNPPIGYMTSFLDTPSSISHYLETNPS